MTAPRDDTTALIVTLDEEANLKRTLSKLKWAKRVLIIDSGSTDRTLEIARCAGATVAHRPFDDFASQCNFGLSLIETEWVLSIDADYELTDDLVAEIAKLEPGRETGGFSARFVYCIFGHPLRGSVYPPRTILYRRLAAHYRNEGHAHRVLISGRVAMLNGRIRHDDRKPLPRWLASQQRYAKIEADQLLSVARLDLGRADRIRLLAWPAPILVFFYALIIKRCLLDGWPGWLYVLQRTLAEVILAIELVDRRLRMKAASGASLRR